MLDNLILLCGEHHRALHEGEFRIQALGAQRFRFVGPDGRERSAAPGLQANATLTDSYPELGRAIAPDTIEPDWDGGGLSDDAVAAYIVNWKLAVNGDSRGEYSEAS